MNVMNDILLRFWMWSRMDNVQYAQMRNSGVRYDAFSFPEFNQMRQQCCKQINEKLSETDIDNFLTCLALDEEEEVILDTIKSDATDQFIDIISLAGCHHIQPDARWQIAELLRCRSIQNGNDYIKLLINDSNIYVRKRAKLAFSQKEP